MVNVTARLNNVRNEDDFSMRSSCPIAAWCSQHRLCEVFLAL